MASGVAALGIGLVLHHHLDTGRSDRVDQARRHIAEALRARTYYLEDVADMVGVQHDADATEFSRYARVRGRRTLSVDGGALSPFERALPWLVFGLTLSVALSLRHSGRRRDAALRLAHDRSEELAVTLQRVERTNQELEAAHAVADRLSRVDPLTGLFNRRHLGELLATELASPSSGLAAVLLLDVDHFKGVNDRYGHLTGDAVLRAAAERIASVTRSSDCLARWGGEEFAILAPGIDREAATLLAERARTALGDHPVQVEGVSIELTLSVGVAVAGPGSRTPDRLIDAADEALYEAKRAGRKLRASVPTHGRRRSALAGGVSSAFHEERPAFAGPSK